MPLRRLVCLPVLLLVSVGCSLPGAGSGDDTASVPEPVARESVVNPDRDQRAVDRALAALDPCALGLAAGARQPGRAYSPSWCELNVGPSSAAVHLEIGVPLSQDVRHHRARRSLAGAVAYAHSPGGQSCGWYLPVSQTMSIEVSGARDEGCAGVDRVAAGVARILTEAPETVLAAPSPAYVPACDWVLAGHGDLAEDEVLVPAFFSSSSQQPGECSVQGPGGGGMSGRLLGVAIDHAHRGQLVASGRRERNVRIAGRTAVQGTGPGECWVDVPVGPLDVPFAGYDDTLRLQAIAVTCPEVRRAATAMVEAVDAMDHTVPDLAGGPLLYPVEDSDLRAVGSCVHVLDAVGRECAPATGADVPEDATDFVRAAQADAEVTCAALLPLVREHFGAELVAGTGVLSAASRLKRAAGEEAGPACHLGEPDHALHLTVAASWTPLDEVRFFGADEVEVAGHAAVEYAPQEVMGAPGRAWMVALGDPAEPGVLAVEVTATADREHGLWQQSPVDESLLDPAPAFVEAAVAGLLD